MRIHPRYFNRFVVIVAITAAVIIVYTTYNYRENREQVFKQQMTEVDTLHTTPFHRFFGKDSLQLHEYRGHYVLLDFWATWSDPSLQSHRQLDEFSSEFADNLKIVAASVRNDSSQVREYRRDHKYTFEFVDGTSFHDHLNIPGVPSQILIDPEGVVIGTFLGYTGSTRYDSLRTLLQHE